MNRVSQIPAISAAFFLITLALVYADVDPNLSFNKVSRKIDLTSQLAKVSTTITLENAGDKAIGSFYYAIEPSLVDKVAFISAVATPENEDQDVQLALKEYSLPTHKDVKMYRVILHHQLASGKTVEVTIEEVFSHTMRPYPSKVGQSEKQQVLFHGNHYVYALYKSKTQTTTVSLASSVLESHSKLKPTSQSENTITYGPYKNVDALKQDEMRIHFENNSPFLTVIGMQRIIEVSHWGNIAVEEIFHIRHLGAELKGSFSRYDYQRTPAPTSIKSFKALLPAAATDVYYRDEIGNISTSNMLPQDDSVELELKPRFPLFGGWQTRYYMGYNVPSYEYLYNLGNNYILKMRFIDHVFDDFVIDHLSVKVILPEGSKDIKLKAPFKVQEGKRELHYTYLDTVGRPVVVAYKQNLVEQHIQEFEIHYSFNKVLLLQEPLLVVGAFYILFLLVIIYVRTDFSISKDEVTESRMRAAGLVEEVLRLLDRRSGLYTVYVDAISKFKSSKDATSFSNARKKLDSDYRSIGNQISQFQSALVKEQSDAVEKITEIQRKENERKQLLDQAIVMAEKVVNGRMQKQTYVDNENSNKAKHQKISSDIEGLIDTL